METLATSLNFRSKEPLSQQLTARIQKLIEQEDLKPGDQLPAVRSMAEILQVNFNTVARAYRTLDQAGWISTQRGRGTYVLEPENRIPQGTAPVKDSITKNNLIQAAADLCQRAVHSGMTRRQLHQLVDRQLTRARILNPGVKQHHRRKFQKRINATPLWSPGEIKSSDKAGIHPHQRKRR